MAVGREEPRGDSPRSGCSQPCRGWGSQRGGGGRGAERDELRGSAGLEPAPAPSVSPRPSAERRRGGASGRGRAAEGRGAPSGRLCSWRRRESRQKKGPRDLFPSPHLHGAARSLHGVFCLDTAIGVNGNIPPPVFICGPYRDCWHAASVAVVAGTH